jgi:hypothetical protein
MKKFITLFAIAGMVLALAPAAQAEVIAPLDGETVYRVIFKYSTVMPNTSTSIAFYNGLIDGEGDAEILSDWRAIASTPTVDAIDNTLTTATDGLAASGDVPIYNTKGVFVWAGNAAMWDGTTTPQGTLNVPGNPEAGGTGFIWTLAGGNPSGGGVDYQRVWTGTNTDGTGKSGNELGTTTIRRGINGGNGYHLNGAQWIDIGTQANTGNLSMYGLSGVIGDVPAVPGTVLIIR